MEKNIKNLKINIMIMIIFVIVFFMLVGFFYSSYMFENIQIDLTNDKTKQLDDTITKSINSDYNLINEGINNNENLEGIILSNRNYIVEAFDIINNEINIGDSNYLVDTENLDKYKFLELNSFISKADIDQIYAKTFLTFYYQESNKLVLIDGNSYINPFISNYNDLINDFVIMNSDGYFLITSSNVLVNNLTSYVSRPDDIYIKDNFMKTNTTGGIKTKVKGLNVFVSVAELNGQYLLLSYSNDLINVQTRMFLSVFLITFGAALILTLLINSYYVFKISRRYEDIELSKKEFYYNKIPIIKISLDGKIRDVNDAFKLLFKDYENYTNINHIFLDDYEILINKIKQQQTITSRLINEDNNTNFSFIPTKSKGGFTLIGIKESITSDKEISYKQLALFNEVTKLPNINAFYNKVDSIIKLLKDTPVNYSFLLVNIVDFRSINRLVGEKTANILIKDIVEIIEADSDFKKNIIYHTKIDNFIIVFEEKIDNQKLISWTNKLITDLNKKMSKSLKISLSLKFSVYNTTLNTIDLKPKDIYDILIDTVNYAKNLTTKNLVFYDHTMESYFKNLKTMENDLSKAIKNDEFEMYLQPQLDTNTNKIVGFETLIRWNNEKYFNESPQKFIELAEKNNLILDIGKITTRKSLEIAQILSKHNIETAINVSPVQIMQIGFVESFLDLHNKYKIPRNMFAIEITENVLMSSFALINEKIRQLKERGINVHLDDFGTGYSSLKYLEQLNVDTIKIDREFIINYPKDTFMRETVNLVVNLAKKLNLGVIVEGVETVEQSKALSKIGANRIQGYLISKAVPLKKALELIDKYNNNKAGENDDVL